MKGKTPALLAFLACATTFASPSGKVTQVACAPTNPKRAVISIDRSIWTTGDGGKNWQQVAKLPVVPLNSNLPKDPIALDENISTNPDDDNPDTKRWLLPQRPETSETREMEDVFESPYLAIGNRGLWAAYFHGRLFIGSPGFGIRQGMVISDVKGLFIDDLDQLWVAARNKLLLIPLRRGSAATVTNQFSVPGAGAPVRGQTPGEILVPSSQGLWKVISKRGQITSVHLDHGPKIEGVALATGPKKPKEIFFISLGTLKIQSPSEIREINRVPKGASRLLVNHHNTPFVFMKRTGWFIWQGGAWRFVQPNALAIDARGREWWGTDHGPVPPRPNRNHSINAFRWSDSVELGQILSGVFFQTSALPGPPQCNELPFNPLPVARIFATFGQDAEYRADNTGFNGNHRESNFFIGIQMIWEFRPPTHWRCISQRKRWHTLIERKTSEVQALWVELQKAEMARRASTDLEERIRSAIKARKIRELIYIKSGHISL
jgi:hypothetical protein